MQPFRLHEGGEGDKIMDARQKRSVSFNTLLSLQPFLISLSNFVRVQPPLSGQITPLWISLERERAPNGTLMTRGNALCEIEHIARLCFLIIRRRGRGEKGEEERKIEKSSGGSKRSGCLIEIENGALSISTLSLSLFLSLLKPRLLCRGVEFVLCSVQIGILITFFSARIFNPIFSASTSTVLDLVRENNGKIYIILFLHFSSPFYYSWSILDVRGMFQQFLNFRCIFNFQIRRAWIIE